MHRFNILDLRLNRFISKTNKVMNSGIHASLCSNCHHQLVKGPFDITCRQNGFNRKLFLIIVIWMIKLIFNENIADVLSNCFYILFLIQSNDLPVRLTSYQLKVNLNHLLTILPYSRLFTMLIVSKMVWTVAFKRYWVSMTMWNATD